MSERPRLALASNMGLTRVYCGPCKSETLHRMQVCVHCGAEVDVERRESTWTYKSGLQIKRRM